jgi:LPS export ABC transporter protein LptC
MKLNLIRHKRSKLKFEKKISITYINIPVILFCILFISACERKMDLIKKSDILSLPSVTVKNLESVVTDSGKIQLIMSAPLVERFTNDVPPHTEFRFGIKVLFYDGNKEPIGSLSSKYARQTESKKLWELRDSVVGVNEKKEKLETELLFWDQEKDLVYTDRFVRITGEDQIVIGTGLVSNSRFSVYTIKKVSLTIPF